MNASAASRLIRASVVALTAALLIAACSGGSGTTPGSTGVPVSSATPVSTPAPRPSIPSAPPQATGPAATSVPSASAASGLVDPGLLDLLPPTAGSLPIEELPVIEAQIAANPAIGLISNGVAVARVVDAEGAVTVITILRLSGLGAGDAAYASYRENYDRSACDGNGGVGSSVNTTIAGVPVDRTSCVGGVTILHLRLRDDKVIVSILAAGPTALAEEIVANLRP